MMGEQPLQEYSTPQKREKAKCGRGGRTEGSLHVENNLEV
jgi:hypothetical protein